MERTCDKCPKCENEILFSCSEVENNMCNRCADKAIQHSEERREWNYWHNEH